MAEKNIIGCDVEGCTKNALASGTRAELWGWVMLYPIKDAPTQAHPYSEEMPQRKVTHLCPEHGEFAHTLMIANGLG